MTRKDRIIEEALSYSGCSKEWFNEKDIVESRQPTMMLIVSFTEQSGQMKL